MISGLIIAMEMDGDTGKNWTAENIGTTCIKSWKEILSQISQRVFIQILNIRKKTYPQFFLANFPNFLRKVYITIANETDVPRSL